MSAPVVEARGLSKRYGKVWDCDFQLPANRIVALVGANGAGKSTLLSIVSGMSAATSGALLFDGRPMVRGGSRVAILAQDKALYRDVSVTDMLRFGPATNRVWDPLLLDAGRAVLAGDIEELLGSHVRHTGRQSTFVMRRPAQQTAIVAPGWTAHPLALDELILPHLRANHDLEKAA